MYAITSEQNGLHGLLGKGMARSLGGINGCYKFLSIFCRKPGIEINTAFIHFSTVYVASGFGNLEKLERPVCIHSVDFITECNHHDTFDDYTHDWSCQVHCLFA